ncbi:hypothetical protein DENSPDRAFT_833160 [Dentipellis sp. KUC8613]|nr:hypothetical protein DENSPDRAFT_833160 [Dentipellis sp. KUC8613]
MPFYTLRGRLWIHALEVSRSSPIWFSEVGNRASPCKAHELCKELSVICKTATTLSRLRFGLGRHTRSSSCSYFPAVYLQIPSIGKRVKLEESESDDMVPRRMQAAFGKFEFAEVRESRS